MGSPTAERPLWLPRPAQLDRWMAGRAAKVVVPGRSGRRRPARAGRRVSQSTTYRRQPRRPSGGGGMMSPRKWRASIEQTQLAASLPTRRHAVMESEDCTATVEPPPSTCTPPLTSRLSLLAALVKWAPVPRGGRACLAAAHRSAAMRGRQLVVGCLRAPAATTTSRE
jgi:hypothetical protein